MTEISGKMSPEQSVEQDQLQTIRAARQVTQRHVTCLSAQQKEELMEQKRKMELHRIILPDAPPRKRRMQKESPEREQCEMLATPLASTSSAAVDYADRIEQHDAGLPIEFVVVGKEEVFPTWQENNAPAQWSTNGVSASIYEEASGDWLGDPDSDEDLTKDNGTDDIEPLPVYRDMDVTNNMTPQLELILRTEDMTNDTALQALLPEDCFTFDWSRDKLDFTAERETFIGTPGPTFDMTDSTRPIDIFEKMFDVEFVDLLCTETNRYASQKIASLKTSNSLSANSRLQRWAPTDRPEMISFLALTIIQGLYPLPNEESYFRFNGFGTMPYIAKIMTYNRYLLLKTMLHFVNNDVQTDEPKQSKLYKIQPIIDYFNTKFSSLYYPKQEIAIDESLLKWHGKLSFSQKIRSKAAQVGVKTYELCESSTGYVWRFSVYTGKNTTATNDDTDNQNDDVDSKPDLTGQAKDRQEQKYRQERPTNATAKIVFDLIEPLLHRGHTVIMDNFYNCPLLARCLKRQKTDCYGTQRLNRQFIPNSLRTLTKTDLRHGEIVATFCSDLSVIVWRDSNLVSMISTYHRLQIGTQDKFNRTTYKPTVVLDYNKHMGGIDRKDQYLSAHPLERLRSHVWYKKLFRRLFNSAVFNCFVLFNNKHKMQHRQFRTILAESLLKTYRQIDLTTETRLVTRTSRQSITPVRQRNSTLVAHNRPIVESEHFPVHSPAKRGRCWWCSHKRQVSSRTIWMCKECGVSLCILGCFRDYHKP